MALRSLSLCAGVGGIDLGLRGVARTVCFVEREAFAAACLVARMEDGSLDPAPVWSDLRTFDARAWRGAVDLVVAGYPCQPFSVAGKRRGADDKRHLWPEVLRILDDCGAPLLFCENVLGHLGLGFSDVLGDLAARGFDAEWDLFAASQVGAPHKRERLFFLAYRHEMDVAGSRRFGLDGLQPDGHSRGGGAASSGGARFDVGDAEGPQRAGSSRSEPQNEGEARSVYRHRTLYPPGPTDADGWSSWIAAGGPEPVVRRGADGVPDRLDRLRALGNAVVPQVAAVAWAVLSHRARGG